MLDAEGNLVTRVWFDGETSHLAVTSVFELSTSRTDPYAFLPEPAPLGSPYEAALRGRLAPWIDGEDAAPEVLALAEDIRAASRDAYDFVHRLNHRLHRDIAREIRVAGEPQAPGETLRLARGACRDIAVLFVAVCRSQGVAARFVSGYQKGRDAPQADAASAPRFMHAWPEVYLPGGGWRGFDPTHGLAVADAHVALAAAARPQDAAPIEGAFVGPPHATTMRCELRIDVDA
jgi:transglutaminase-like putative cysteine protease